MAKVFISYHSADREKLDLILETMRVKGIVYYIDTENLLTGTNPLENLRGGLGECDVCLFLATPDSVGRHWCLVETGAFWARGRPVIVLRHEGLVKEAELPGHLVSKSTQKPTEALRAVELAMRRASDTVQTVSETPATPGALSRQDIYDAVRAAIGPAFSRGMDLHMLALRGALHKARHHPRSSARRVEEALSNFQGIHGGDLIAAGEGAYRFGDAWTGGRLDRAVDRPAGGES